MMTYQEISEFLTSFNTNSYNRSQIGNSKQLIITIYEFLNKLNISKQNIDILISNIAYLNKDDINVALYLELLSKSLGHATTYDLREVIKTIKEIHDIYFKSSAMIPLEEYIHDTNDERTRKLFLNRNNKYLVKNFESDFAINAIADLKFASAIALDQKEYKEFINYIDNFENYQDSYSPLLVFKTYTIVREELKEEKRLFWDIFFGNEYTVALYKHNIPINEIYKKNIFNQKKPKKATSQQIAIQIDLFSLLEEEEVEEEITINEDIKSFQLCTLYNGVELPEFDKEKDLILYYERLIQGKQTMVLPKLKNRNFQSFMYEIN